MHNLEMNKNQLSLKNRADENSKLEAKKLSRRLFIQISLMSLSVASSIDNLKTNKDELDKETTSKKNQFVAKAPKQDTSSDGSNKPGHKGKSSINDSASGGSIKPGHKGKTKPRDAVPNSESSNPGV